MIEIFPSPLNFTGAYDSSAIESSLESKWPGASVTLFNSVAFYSLNTTASYNNIQSSSFEVEVWNPNTSQYSSVFVYKCGLTKGVGIGQFNDYSVWGEGVTGAPKGSFTPLLASSHGQFNYFTFGTDEETKIRVKYKKGPISSIDIGPYSKGFNSKWSRVIDTSTVEISGINPNHKLFIQVSTTFGLDASTPLMVFADPPSPVPPAGANVIYFAPGIFECKKFNSDFSSTGVLGIIPPFNVGIPQRFDLSNIGLHSLIPSGPNYIYIDGGAYIDGTFGCKFLSGVIFTGRGVIDAYRGDDWWDKWSSLIPGVSDETKLAYSPFMGYSSFSEGSNVLGKSPNNKLEGLTVVNQITYTNTINFIEINNAKVINQIPNGDFFRVAEYPEWNNRVDRLARITNCFGFVGDDCFYPAEADCDTIASSCYIIPIYATAFRTYGGRYNTPYYTGKRYGFSAIDIDVRTYSPIGFYDKNRPIYTQFKPSIFGLWMTTKKDIAASIGDSDFKNYVGDCLFSGIRVEGYCDVPLFDIGVRSYPGSVLDANSVNQAAVDYSEVYGNISGIKFVDITANSHPYSKYKWVYSNAIFASEPKYRPYDITFTNVSIDGVTIRDENKNEFFLWENYSVPEDTGRDLSYPVNGSSIADIYLLLGDGLAYGFSGQAKDLSTISQYSAVISSGVAIPGCYIFSPSGSFVPLIPGITTVESNFGYGDMGLETFLAYQLKQKSGNRDVYFIKCASGDTLPVSSFSGYYEGPNQGTWSISATNSMFARYQASATAAVAAIRAQNKYPDLKAGFICLGGTQPGEARNNFAAASALINTDISGLILGIRSTFASATPPGLNVDTTYTELFWVGPSFGDSLAPTGFDYTNSNNFKYYLKQKLYELDSSSYRLNYYNTDYQLFNTADLKYFHTSGYALVADDLIELYDQETSSVTNPNLNPEVNYLFFPLVQKGFATSKGIVLDYHLDRGQLHPYVATLHHINEQSKIMQASAYYDDNLAELAQDNWWSNKLVNYANTLTEFSGAFPNSIEDYTTYEFGKEFHKLYYDYTNNFARHRLVPNVMQLDGPTIFSHVYGPIFYNSNFSKNGSFTAQYPQYIASSLLTVPEFNSKSVLFSTSGASSGTYVASTVADVLTYTEGGSIIPEFRNSGILSHVEFIHPSGANSSNSFSVIRLDKNNKTGYKYNSLTHENTLIRQKSTNSKSRFAFDLRKYSVDTNLGYDVSTNFLTPEHEFSLDLKSLICNNVGEVLGGDSISVWVHTKPEDGKIWSYTQDGRWVQHSLSDVKSSNLVQSYCHVFNLPSQARDTGASLRCGRFKLSDNPNRENDVIASLTESEFNQLNITFNTFNRDIEVPQEYFDKISTSVHRLNQNYVIEIFSNCISQDKFTLFYDIKLVDMTLNKWSKPLVLSKTCKDYRVDLDKRHLYNIFKYFNEIAGAYSSFGYANRTASYTSEVYEANGGSRINYVENPEWNSVSKSSAGQFINNLNLNN
jgi:hypothetical protein